MNAVQPPLELPGVPVPPVEPSDPLQRFILTTLRLRGPDRIDRKALVRLCLDAGYLVSRRTGRAVTDPDRMVREAIHELRRLKHHIAMVAPSGYCLTRNLDERKRLVAELKSRAFDELETARGLEQSLAWDAAA